MKSTSEQRSTAANRFYEPLASSSTMSRRVGWESDAAHRFRLRHHLALIGPLADVASILDAGCGEGALLEEALRAGFRGRYRGEDILPSMIEAAQRRFASAAGEGEGAASIEWVSWDSLVGGPRAEAVICCGALNHRVGDDPTSEVIAAIDALWARAERVAVIDFAVRSRHHDAALLALADLEPVWRHVRSLSPVNTVMETTIPGEAVCVLQRDRGPILRRHLSEPELTCDRAEILLAAKESYAVLRELGDLATPRAELLRGLAGLQIGGWRQSEVSLKKLVGDPEVGERARLTLAALYRALKRTVEAEALLGLLVRDGNDEARLLLGMVRLDQGRRDEARTLMESIVDPWIAREAQRLLSE
ncbi:MAG: methyltransferase domain-containing protein [Myxococcales bacterium]|nr:methyltransferase domain-containing protein [Myxococcales bacterium]